MARVPGFGLCGDSDEHQTHGSRIQESSPGTSHLAQKRRKVNSRGIPFNNSPSTRYSVAAPHTSDSAGQTAPTTPSFIVFGEKGLDPSERDFLFERATPKRELCSGVPLGSC